MELMESGKKWDLAVVDPPYGIGGDSHNSNKALKGAGKLKDRILNTSNTKWDIAPEQIYFDTLKNVTANQIIWGGNYFPLPPSRCIIVWDKVQPWENFSQVEIAWTSFKSPASLYKYDNRTGDKIHPTAKPIDLYRWILQKYAKAGDTILDTHGGSMSSAIACDMEGFELDICELDKEYFDKAVHRFKLHELQLNIFTN
jgi:site-specific DNA-methyltransferase (adenine-specific)